MFAFFTSGFLGAMCAGVMVDKFKKFKMTALGFVVLCKKSRCIVLVFKTIQFTINARFE